MTFSIPKEHLPTFYSFSAIVLIGYKGKRQMSSYMLPFGDLVNYFIDIKFHSIINVGTIGSDETPTAQLAIISHVEIQDLKDHWSTGENQV